MQTRTGSDAAFCSYHNDNDNDDDGDGDDSSSHESSSKVLVAGSQSTYRARTEHVTEHI